MARFPVGAIKQEGPGGSFRTGGFPFPERDPFPPRRAAVIQNFREAIFQYGGKGECNR